MTLHLNTDDVEKAEKQEAKTSDEMEISDPLRSEQTICVKFNRVLG